MDFKVCGTERGITALQMDNKARGLSVEILAAALAQAKEGRAHILGKMMEAIQQPRAELSEFAPRIITIKIPVDKIRDVIGTGGKVINQIIADCDNVKIDIEDDGRVTIYHMDLSSIDKAKAMIENIVRVAKVGEIYDAKVVRMEKFGAFVELFPGTDGLLHVSKIANRRVEKPEDVLKMGDIIKVKVMEIDEKGRVNVSAKALLPKEEGQSSPRESDSGKGKGFHRSSFKK